MSLGPIDCPRSVNVQNFHSHRDKKSGERAPMRDFPPSPRFNVACSVARLEVTVLHNMSDSA
jgi:hypothetical protein